MTGSAGWTVSARGVVPTTKPLPLRIEPLDDEPLDNYLEHFAHTFNVQPSVLLAQIGVRDLDGTPYALCRGLTREQAGRVAFALSLDEQQVHAMTLSKWQHLGLTPPRLERRGNFAGAWPRGKGTRFCPACLRERDMRGQLTHRLQHVYICVRHQVWLETRCRGCGRVPRTHGRYHPRETDPLTRVRCRLSCAMRAFADVDASPCDAPGLVHAQEWFLQHLSNPKMDVWDGRLPAAVALSDLAALTRLALSGPPGPIDPARFSPGLAIPDEVRAALDATPAGSGAARLRAAIDDVRLGAFALSVAVHVMSAPTAKEAAERLDWLTTTNQTRLLSARGASPISAQLTELLGRRFRGGGAKHRVRVSLLVTSGEIANTRSGPLPSTRVPAALWPTAQPALAELVAVHPWYGSSLCSIVLLSVASQRRWQSLATDLGTDLLAGITEQRLRGYVREMTGHPGLPVLLSLFAALREVTPPIEYQRRRELFATGVTVGRNQARRVASANCDAATDAQARRCAWYLWELLTGGDATLGRSANEMYGARRRGYQSWKRNLTARAEQELFLLAEGQLKRHRLPEPVFWGPVHRDGEWHLPDPDLTRRLQGWVSVPLRAASRPVQSAQDLDLLLRRATSGADPALAKRISRFLALADNGCSFTRTAALCAVDQGAVSQQILRLERQLGAQLIERAVRNRPGNLTELGVEMVKQAKSRGLAQAEPERRVREP